MTLNDLLTRARWLLVGLAAVAWIAFHAWILHAKIGVDPRLALLDSTVSNGSVLVISALVIIALRRYMPEGGKLWFAVAVSVFLSLVCVWITIEVVIPEATGQFEYQELVYRTGPLRWSFNFLLMGGLTVASVLHFRALDEHAANERQRATAAMVREAELQKLQLQLQPHFLFNCLNSINALIIVRPPEARKMVEQLSEFLRITLKRADEHWVKLEEEWSYLQLYLEIEKIRFGHRLEVVTSFEDGVMDWRIPTLVLQPLVENAIKFGLYGTTGSVTISLDARRLDDLLEIRVTNPFSEDALTSKGNGFGLAGLQRRMYLLFARNDLLQTASVNYVFTVTLKIPRNHDSNDID
ncbi:MAG TPA: histidine kinase [Cyclobacteriaceae bacterium]